MIRQLLLVAGLATAAGAVHAQPGPTARSTLPPPTARSALQAGSDVAAVARPGMTVTDSTGATVGTVTQVGKTSAGESAVLVNVDGRPFTLAADQLSTSGGGLVSLISKAQLEAAPKAPN